MAASQALQMALSEQTHILWKFFRVYGQTLFIWLTTQTTTLSPKIRKRLFKIAMYSLRILLIHSIIKNKGLELIFQKSYDNTTISLRILCDNLSGKRKKLPIFVYLIYPTYPSQIHFSIIQPTASPGFDRIFKKSITPCRRSSIRPII